MHIVPILETRLADRRSKQVIFLAHCLLNENTRYLGGACTGGCVRAVVDPCVAHGIGIVQLPCPEQEVWGGVLKRWLLWCYGLKRSWLYRVHPILLPLARVYTYLRYRHIATRIAHQIQDYQDSGFTVIAVVGVDGSPSCGVHTTLDLDRAFDHLAALDVARITPADMTALIGESMHQGPGLFITALERSLARRGVTISFLAHDLMDELAGKVPPFDIPGTA